MSLWILIVHFIEYFVFIVPLLGIIYSIFCEVDCGGQVCSIAHFPSMHLYPVPADSPMNGRNMPQKVVIIIIIINEHTVFRCCVCVD